VSRAVVVAMSVDGPAPKAQPGCVGLDTLVPPETLAEGFGGLVE